MPEDIRRAVIEGCRKQLLPRPLHIVICAVFAVIFIPLGLSVLSDREFPEEKLVHIVWGTVFLLVPFLIAYSTILKPWRYLWRAKKNNYEYYIGELTDADIYTTDEGSEYHLTLDGEIKCYCTKKQYKKAVIGERYIAVYFDDEDPTLFLLLPQKDII